MTPPESYVTPAIKELFKPQFAPKTLISTPCCSKTWQDFAEGRIRWPKAVRLPTDMTATVGSLAK